MLDLLEETPSGRSAIESHRQQLAHLNSGPVAMVRCMDGVRRPRLSRIGFGGNIVYRATQDIIPGLSPVLFTDFVMHPVVTRNLNFEYAYRDAPEENILNDSWARSPHPFAYELWNNSRIPKYRKQRIMTDRDDDESLTAWERNQ